MAITFEKILYPLEIMLYGKYRSKYDGQCNLQEITPRAGINIGICRDGNAEQKGQHRNQKAT